MEELKSTLIWLGLEANTTAALRISVSLILGGGLAIYLGVLYRFCSHSVSGKQEFSAVFPLLTIVTIVVISVVKASLALSLGLVGALSIVRFRAAIKDPEELVYLFMCIGLGLSLGAGKLVPAVALVFVASLFILGRRFLVKGFGVHSLLLTITGDAPRYFDKTEDSAMSAVEETFDRYTLQRYEVADDRGCLRVVIPNAPASETASMISSLRSRLPGCEIAYVNMEHSF